MSAQGNLSEPQFSEWYHGTSKENGPSIEREGLRSESYGLSNDRPYYTLTTQKDEAAHMADPTGRKGGAVVTVRVPGSKAGEYLTSRPGEKLGMLGSPRLSGINKPLPASMIHHVDYI